MIDVVVLLFVLYQISLAQRTSFNPNGPEFEGRSGSFSYAIFASVEVTHSRAIQLCSTYYFNGRLGWLGDTSVEPIRAIIDQSMAFHYINFNNFFWIDGELEDDKCKPEVSSCKWISTKYSHVEKGAAKSFKNTNVVHHSTPTRPINATSGDTSYWPILLPNANAEYDASEPFILSAAPGYVKAGFICAHRGEVGDCPFGFTSMTITTVPPKLTPTKVKLGDICGKST